MTVCRDHASAPPASTKRKKTVDRKESIACADGLKGKKGVSTYVQTANSFRNLRSFRTVVSGRGSTNALNVAKNIVLTSNAFAAKLPLTMEEPKGQKA